MEHKPRDSNDGDLEHSFRRDPKQARSRALVDAILEAVHRLTIEHELQVTTKKVAELAGVSIGSLYQYFPSKDSMLSTWWRNVTHARIATFLSALDASANKTLPEAIASIVDHAIAARTGHGGTERALLRGYQRFGYGANTSAVDKAIVDRVAQLLRDHEHETRDLDPTLSAFVMVFAMRWVLFAATYVPGMLTHPALRNELVYLLNAYVAKPAAAATSGQ